MNPTFAIVVPAYNRPHCLVRLLNSIAKANYTQSVDLIISVDDATTQFATVHEAKYFEWQFGNKHVIENAQHLGLKQHILQCGNIVNQYDAIILLEDDLMVSSSFFAYAYQAFTFYKDEDRVAGISLYNYHITESGFYPFYPKQDGSDVYFLQVASSWGQCWTKKQWTDFRTWLKENPELPEVGVIPIYIKSWGINSWKKHFINYLILSDKYFVFPHFSLSTNFGDIGTNTDRKGLFQTQLMEGERSFTFYRLAESKSIYDAWFEQKIFHFFSYNETNTTLDLYGEKELKDINFESLISSKKCLNPIKCFGFELTDSFQNIEQNVTGDFFSLGRSEDFINEKPINEKFYPQFNEIKELVFHDFIENKASELGKIEFEKHLYNQQYPTFSIHIIANESDGLKQTLKSISLQVYPFVNVHIHTKHTITNIRKCTFINDILITQYDNHYDILMAINKSVSAYNAIIEAGDEFVKGAFEAANKIFKRFVEIYWIYGIVSEKRNNVLLPPQPISQRRFTAATLNKPFEETGKTTLLSSGVFFANSLAKLVIPQMKYDSSKSLQHQLYNAFIRYAALYSTSFYIAYSKERPLVYHFKFDIKRWFFEKNLPYLRYFFRRQENLTPVVRFEHKTNSYYLSDY